MPAPPGMNPAVYEAMALTGEDQAMSPYSQDDPEAPIPIVDRGGQEQMVDPSVMAAEGMAYAGQYMASNGPIQASHSLESQERGLDGSKMTKAQLREQRMNEDQGYPSNLDEAEKVKSLESKIQGLDAKLDAIVAAVQAPRTSRVQDDPSSLASPESNEPTGGNPVFPAEPRTLGPLATALQPSPNSTVSSESKELENKQPKLRQVTLKDGRKISVPVATSPATPMSVGPATDQPRPPTQLEEENLSPGDNWDDPVAVVPKAEPEAPPDIISQRLGQTQQLVQDVNAFIQTHDVHRFWRRHLSQNIHRHVGYNGWPKELQTEFDNRFKGFLQDPQFVTSVCRKVIDMELGHALGVKWVVSFLVATAGFTSFALCGID